MQESNYNRIQDYFENKMSEADTTDFKIEIENNKDLQNEVAEYKTIVSGIETFGMQQMLDQIHEEEITKKPKSSVNSLKIIGLVALLALIGALAYQLINIPQKENVEPLEEPVYQSNIQYAKSMKSLEGLPVTLSSDNQAAFQEAMIAYRMKDFNKADKLFEQINASNRISDTISIYHANVLIELGQYQQAISLLSPLTITDNSPYYYDAIWFQAKAYLSYDKLDSARVMIKKLTDSDNKYQDHAVTIFEKIGGY